MAEKWMFMRKQKECAQSQQLQCFSFIVFQTARIPCFKSLILFLLFPQIHLTLKPHQFSRFPIDKNLSLVHDFDAVPQEAHIDYK